MSYIVGSLPRFFQGYIRREWTRNLEDGYGDYWSCVIHGIRAVRGRTLELQCMITDPARAGAGFLAPIQAFCWRIPNEPRVKDEPIDMTYVQPWDTFSSEFSAHSFELHDAMKCVVLPERRPARYRCTLDFIGSSLAEMGAQHKHLHIVDMNDGSIGAFPNNRMLYVAPEWFKEPGTEFDFIALDHDSMAE